MFGFRLALTPVPCLSLAVLSEGSPVRRVRVPSDPHTSPLSVSLSLWQYSLEGHQFVVFGFRLTLTPVPCLSLWQYSLEGHQFAVFGFRLTLTPVPCLSLAVLSGGSPVRRVWVPSDPHTSPLSLSLAVLSGG